MDDGEDDDPRRRHASPLAGRKRPARGYDDDDELTITESDSARLNRLMQLVAAEPSNRHAWEAALIASGLSREEAETAAAAAVAPYNTPNSEGAPSSSPNSSAAPTSAASSGAADAADNDAAAATLASMAAGRTVNGGSGGDDDDDDFAPAAPAPRRLGRGGGGGRGRPLLTAMYVAASAGAATLPPQQHHRASASAAVAVAAPRAASGGAAGGGGLRRRAPVRNPRYADDDEDDDDAVEAAYAAPPVAAAVAAHRPVAAKAQPRVGGGSGGGAGGSGGMLLAGSLNSAGSGGPRPSSMLGRPWTEDEKRVLLDQGGALVGTVNPATGRTFTMAQIFVALALLPELSHRTAKSLKHKWLEFKREGEKRVAPFLDFFTLQNLLLLLGLQLRQQLQQQRAVDRPAKWAGRASLQLTRAFPSQPRTPVKKKMKTDWPPHHCLPCLAKTLPVKQ
jgi:hypothetical protein